MYPPYMRCITVSLHPTCLPVLQENLDTMTLEATRLEHGLIQGDIVYRDGAVGLAGVMMEKMFAFGGFGVIRATESKLEKEM